MIYNYIPDNSIILLSGVPLSKEQQFTRAFSDGYEQINWFRTHYLKNEYELLSPIKIGEPITLPVIQYELLNVNYIAFTIKYGEVKKWVFAFVDSINYIGLNACSINYTIDVLQSFYFDYKIKDCLIEREHVESDIVGEHTQAENINIGEYITTNENNLLVESLSVYLLTTSKEVGIGALEPQIIGGFPQACYVMKFGTLNDYTTSAIKTIIDYLVSEGKQDSIISIFTAPTNFVSTTRDVRKSYLSGAKIKLPFKPKNNKLYTYPFTALTVQCGGSALVLKYEMFNDTPNFEIVGGFGANMQVAMYPLKYEGKNKNMEYCLTLTGFPLIPYTTNYYQNWLAYNKNKVTHGVVNNLINTGVNFVGSAFSGNVGGVFSSLTSGLNYGVNLSNDIAIQKMIPDNLSGSANATDILSASKQLGFYTSCKTLKTENLKKIDDYFNMFGYCTNRIGTPNLKSRKGFNYIKLTTCNFESNINNEYLEEIKNIYKKGVTFFHNDIGNYNQDNSIT